MVQHGCEVHTLIRATSDVYRIKDILPSLHVVESDLLDEVTLDQQVRRIRPECCIHLAWYVEPGKYPSALENMDLLRASLRISETLANVGCQRLIAAGTLFEYDLDLASSGSRDGAVSESSPTRPRHLYAASKLALFEALQQFCKLAGMDLAWTRLFYQYGPFENPRRLVPVLINSLLRGQPAELTPGEQVCDYLHVHDTAAAIWAIAQSKLTGVVNVGSGQAVSVRELALKIGQFLSRPDLVVLGAKPYVPDWPMHIVADSTRLRQHTDWKPSFDLDSGLRHTIEWWKSRL